MKRLARIADGWFPMFRPEDTGRETLARLHGYIEEAGRKPEDVGIEGRINLANGDPDQWAKEVAGWRELGATHLGINTMGAGLASPRDHIEAIRQVKESIG